MHLDNLHISQIIFWRDASISGIAIRSDNARYETRRIFHIDSATGLPKGTGRAVPDFSLPDWTREREKFRFYIRHATQCEYVTRDQPW